MPPLIRPFLAQIRSYPSIAGLHADCALPADMALVWEDASSARG